MEPLQAAQAIDFSLIALFLLAEVVNLVAGALAVAALHLAGAYCGFGFQRQVADAHVFQHRQHFGPVAQGAADFRQGDIAHHHRAAHQALAQRHFGGIGARPARLVIPQ